jgi:hypothetical protein
METPATAFRRMVQADIGPVYPNALAKVRQTNGRRAPAGAMEHMAAARAMRGAPVQTFISCCADARDFAKKRPQDQTFLKLA